MKHSIQILSTLLLLSSAPSAWAQGGTGTSGGGTGYVNREGDKVQLQDLATTAACDSRSRTTKAVLYKFKLESKIDAILTATFELHPLMGYLVRRELDSMTWCLSQKLKRIQTEDPDSVFAGDFLPKVQIGIRDIERKIIYIDEPNLLKMNEDHRAMTLIHEVMHSFLDRDLPRRNDTLRDLTRSLYDAYTLTLEKEAPSIEIQREQLDRLIYMAKLEFGSTGYGLAFRRAVEKPATVSKADLSLLSKGWQNRGIFDLIVNEIGQAKLAGRLFQLGRDRLYLNTNAQMEEYLQYARKEAASCTSRHLTLEGDCVPFSWGQLYAFDKSGTIHAPKFSSKVGACEFESDYGVYDVQSAGIVSNSGISAKVDLIATLTGPQGSVTANYADAVQSHSIAIFVPIGKSFAELLTDAFSAFKQDYKKIPKAVLSGACDIPNSKYRKYFH